MYCIFCVLQYREYQLKQGRDGAVLDIGLMDTMGMAVSGGIMNEDVTTVLDGKTPNTAAVSTEKFIQYIKLKLASVLSINSRFAIIYTTVESNFKFSLCHLRYVRILSPGWNVYQD